jgi:rhodanese-related sulfurtransferase
MRTHKLLSARFSIIVFILAHSLFTQGQAQTDLKPKAFAEKLNQFEEEIILDVRADWEYQSGHLSKAININYDGDDFESDIARLDRNKPYFLYCYSGGRSTLAAKAMRKLGFKEIYELDGGIEAWIEAKLPVTKGK